MHCMTMDIAILLCVLACATLIVHQLQLHRAHSIKQHSLKLSFTIFAVAHPCMQYVAMASTVTVKVALG